MNRRLGTTIILTAPGDRYLRKFCSVLVYLDNGHISKIRSGESTKLSKQSRPNKKKHSTYRTKKRNYRPKS